MGGNMGYLDRKKEILSILYNKNGVIKPEKLKEILFISTSTLRRDLITLENEGLITRHHGGITLNKTSSSESSASMRKLENQDKKLIIAKIAEKYVKENMVIFLDSSSTVSQLVPLIRTRKNLTIITNGINIASQLYLSSDINCYICPGLVKPKSYSIIGEYAADFLKNFKADLAFFSSKSVKADGIYEGDDSQAFCKRIMLNNANRKIMLCDNTKENVHGFVKLVDYSQINMIISNGKFSDQFTSEVEKFGCQIITPKSELYQV